MDMGQDLTVIVMTLEAMEVDEISILTNAANHADEIRVVRVSEHTWTVNDGDSVKIIGAVLEIFELVEPIL